METKKGRAFAAAKELGNALNDTSFDCESFAIHVTRCEHRTIQQLIFKAVLELLAQWAADAESGNFDARNEFTVQTAKVIMAAFDGEVPSPPYI
jgi:hypothetical protein